MMDISWDVDFTEDFKKDFEGLPHNVTRKLEHHLSFLRTNPFASNSNIISNNNIQFEIKT